LILDSEFVSGWIIIEWNNIVPNGMDDPLNHPKMVVVFTYLKLYFVLAIFDAFNHYEMRNRLNNQKKKKIRFSWSNVWNCLKISIRKWIKREWIFPISRPSVFCQSGNQNRFFVYNV
jgi:hypothetical protein